VSLFTLVLDYHGGTYLSQFDAATPVEAVGAWCRPVENSLVGIDGLCGAWCAATAAAGGLALLNVIQTEPTAH
jgi:hypothetical protein